MVDFSYKLPSAIPQDAVSAAPPRQQFKAAPPGNLTREHQTDPRSSHPTSISPRDRPEPDWVSASPAGVALQAPVSAAPKSHPSTSTRASHVSLQVRVKATWMPLPTGQTHRRGMRSEQPKQASGQHQGRSLVYRQPVSLHELHPADDRTVGRVHLVYLKHPAGSRGKRSTP